MSGGGGGGGHHGADGGGNSNGLGDNDSRISGAVGDSVGAVGHGGGVRAVDGRSCDREDGGRDNSAGSRAVGDLGRAGGDGVVLSGVDGGLRLLRDFLGENGAGKGNGSNSETHFGGWMGCTLNNVKISF